MDKQAQAAFDRIAQSNTWGDERSISGPGSTPQTCFGIMAALPDLCRRHGVRRLLDAPCGDVFWLREILPSLALDEYLGMDISTVVVDQNRQRATTDPRLAGARFAVADIVEDDFPATDLVLVKDLTQHLSNERIRALLRHLAEGPARLVLVSSYYQHRNELDIVDGDCRTVDLAEAPWRLPEPIERIEEPIAEPARWRRWYGLWTTAQLQAWLESAKPALHRREAGAALRPYEREFFALKDRWIPPLVGQVARHGRLDDADLLHPMLANLDERAVEYPVVAEAIARAPRQGRLRLLDVGCVLNNSMIEPVLREHCDMLWLMNASAEKPQVGLPLAYMLGDARHFPRPEGLQFDLVTCLSTLEHFGMDNTRYGGTPAEFEGVVDDPERFAAEGVRRIADWVRPGGEILLSVPFGPFEFLYVHGQPGKPIYYTFDAQRLAVLEDALRLAGIEPVVRIYKLVHGKGWLRTTADDTAIARHAEGCAAAGGVAFLSGRRPTH